MFSLLQPKYLPTWVGMGLIYLCKFFPYKVLIVMGALLGHLLYLVSPHRKQIAKANMQLCFPDKSRKEIHDLVKGHFKNMGIGVFEIAVGWWSSDEAIEKLKATHLDHIELYGADLDQRLTGLHETQSIDMFSYGVSDRGASIRIPIHTVEAGWKV